MKLFFLLLALPLLACGMQAPAQVATPAATVQPATIGRLVRATDAPQTFTVLQPVWVRTIGGRKVEAVTGGTFGGFCSGNWCYILDADKKVWRGCTDHADGLGCERVDR
jgi:hypothetical protein